MTYNNMLRRCDAPTGKDARDYHDRGITVCERWRYGEAGKTGFECFMEDMGSKPVGMTIERIDTNGNYEPSNCRWATIVEQANNKRNNRIVVYHGEPMTLANAWATSPRHVSVASAYDRVAKHGWPVDAALDTPRLVPAGKREAGSRHY